ncbi:hypothetical protein H5410_030350 [Solanum commersonii]|uniref:Uncharacterized protein n=1 Tax=Solanum commersonii TaxID=4109 RepID=A0A9J5YIF1_SOLCO|nr:hypothetical protein H5410_030350 [Solanum commersonii]
MCKFEEKQPSTYQVAQMRGLANILGCTVGQQLKLFIWACLWAPNTRTWDDRKNREEASQKRGEQELREVENNPSMHMLDSL